MWTIRLICETSNILMNIFVYAICLFLFNVEIVVYSLIYTTVLSLAIDRVHIQNINTSVMIFTKKLGISKAIMESPQGKT